MSTTPTVGPVPVVGRSGALAALLMDHPAQPDEGLLFSVDREVTAADARTAAAALCDELIARGIAPGDVVGVRLPSGPDSVIAMVAVWLAGAVFVPLNPSAPPVDVEASLDATGAGAVVEPGEPLRVRERTPARRVEHPADAALVLWTSGTTGPPKPIVHTHGSYLAVIDRVLAPLRGSGRADQGRLPPPNLIPVSMALNSGIFNALFGLRAGSALVIMERFVPRDFAALVARFGIRSSVLPPAAIVMLNDADESEIADLAPLRFVRSITAPLSPVQARRFIDRFGVFVLNGYGQAELGEVVGWTASDAREHADKLGSVGRPHPGVSLRIVGPDGAEAPSGEVGALHIRTPSMADGSGSTAGSALSARLDAEGHLDTGDLARVDAEGFVWIEGRAGNLINRGGHKVFPEQVEEILEMAPQVAEAAVVGVPDDRLGEVPVALVVDVAGVSPAGDDDLRAHCREHLVAYKVPTAFHRVAALPRTESGKLARARIASIVPSTTNR